MRDPNKEYGKSHVGSTFITNEGYQAEVIAPGSKPGYITIQIGEWTTERQSCVIKTGELKNPFHPSVFNIAYFGSGDYSSKHASYTTWNDMIARCYSTNNLNKNRCYKDVTVCTQWLNFQEFAKWYDTKYKEDGWQLDKDLLSDPNNKVYSPTTCVLIPKVLNSFLINSTDEYAGIDFNKQTRKWRARISTKDKGYICLGYFKNKQVATLAYKLARQKEARKWQEEMLNVLPNKAVKNIK